MRILLTLIFSSIILLSQTISLSDLQKYQEYKTLLDSNTINSSASKSIKMQEVNNNINNTISTSIEKDTFTQLKDKAAMEVTNPFKYESQSLLLKRYGETFFQNQNTLNPAIIPSSNNYILNNGDKIIINTYEGKNTKTYDLVIDNNGNINLPGLGLMKITSLTLGEAKTLISQKLNEAFPTAKIIVDIGEYSSIQVVVTGNVKVPGIYNLNSFSTVKDALIASNGLLEVGSYRDIDVIRKR